DGAQLAGRRMVRVGADVDLLEVDVEENVLRDGEVHTELEGGPTAALVQRDGATQRGHLLGRETRVVHAHAHTGTRHRVIRREVVLQCQGGRQVAQGADAVTADRHRLALRRRGEQLQGDTGRQEVGQVHF